MLGLAGSARHNQFGRGVAGNGEHQLVLDGGKERFGGLGGAVVVGAAGFEEVADLLVEPLFRGADVADAPQQLVKIVEPARLLQPGVVQHKTLDQELAQHGGRPAAELAAARAADAVADRQNGVEIVDLERAPDRPAALLLNL
jgi:hypothetical protein